jgi:myo-inositol-1(or 4)-monophosphatase
MIDSRILDFARQRSPLVALAMEAAKRGGEVLLQFWEGVDSNRVWEKGRGDLVTQADLESEKAIADFLKKETPEWSIVAEEGTEITTGDTVWFVDPLDGTTNFVQRFPIFSVSIGLTQRLPGGDYDLQAGVVANPISGDVFWGVKGGGSYLGTERLRVSTKENLADAVIGTGFPRRSGELTEYLKEFAALYPLCRAFRRPGSASLDLCWTAQSIFDAFWERRLAPWDIAAACLIVMEAGGICTDFHGQPHFLKSGNILGASPALHRQMLAVLAPLQSDPA